MPSSRDLLHQHAELGAPIPDVILGNDPVPDSDQDPMQAVADDRRPQMADVHLFGDVRTGIVDHHCLRLLGGAHAGPWVGQLVGDRLRQHLGSQPKVDEARAGDLRAARTGRRPPAGRRSESPPRGGLALALGQAQRDIRLVVTELRLGGRPEFRINAGDAEDPVAQQRGQRRHKSRLSHWPAD